MSHAMMFAVNSYCNLATWLQNILMSFNAVNSRYSGHPAYVLSFGTGYRTKAGCDGKAKFQVVKCRY